MEHKLQSTRVSAKSRCISLEEYVGFVHANKQLNMTANYLNQIISLHGYKKLHGASKNVLANAVNTLELVDLSRSTLKESISSSATVSLEEIIKDLNDLKWQECCVTSVQTFSAWKHGFSPSSPNRCDLGSRKRSKTMSVLDISSADGASSSRSSEIIEQVLKSRQ